MPTQGQIGQLVLLGKRLLDATLTEVPLTAFRQLADRLGRVTFAHSEQPSRGRKLRLESGPAIEEGA